MWDRWRRNWRLWGKNRAGEKRRGVEDAERRREKNWWLRIAGGYWGMFDRRSPSPRPSPPGRGGYCCRVLQWHATDCSRWVCDLFVKKGEMQRRRERGDSRRKHLNFTAEVTARGRI